MLDRIILAVVLLLGVLALGGCLIFFWLMLPLIPAGWQPLALVILAAAMFASMLSLVQPRELKG